MSACTCYQTDPKTWTRYGGAIEPGSVWEPNPDCLVHFPENDPEGRALVDGIIERKKARA